MFLKLQENVLMSLILFIKIKVDFLQKTESYCDGRSPRASRSTPSAKLVRPVTPPRCPVGTYVETNQTGGPFCFQIN